jgi:hypothetical protein
MTPHIRSDAPAFYNADESYSPSPESTPFQAWGSYWSLDGVFGVNFEEKVRRRPSLDVASPLGGINWTYGVVPRGPARIVGFGSAFQYFYGGEDNHYLFARPSISFQGKSDWFQVQLGPVIGASDKTDIDDRSHLRFLTGAHAIFALGLDDGGVRHNILGLGGGIFVTPEARDRDVSAAIQAQISPLMLLATAMLGEGPPWE